MSFSSKQILQDITFSLGNSAFKKKYKRNPDIFFTLRELCEKVGIETSCFDESVKEKLNTTVSYICRLSPVNRFTKNCICVQLYEDSDDVMRKAIQLGALVCVTDHKIEGVPCIVVENTAVTYADLCSIIRNTANIKTTVIAGSIGKTTTKKMVDAVYSSAFNTLCDSGNDNILDSIGSICQHTPPYFRTLYC